VSSLGLPSHATLLTTVELGGVHIVRHLNVGRNVARIREGASQVREYRHHAKTIEDHKVGKAIEGERYALDRLFVLTLLIEPVEDAQAISGPAAVGQQSLDQDGEKYTAPAIYATHLNYRTSMFLKP
jgi:hypothetical protein